MRWRSSSTSTSNALLEKQPFSNERPRKVPCRSELAEAVEQDSNRGGDILPARSPRPVTCRPLQKRLREGLRLRDYPAISRLPAKDQRLVDVGDTHLKRRRHLTNGHPDAGYDVGVIAVWLDIGMDIGEPQASLAGLPDLDDLFRRHGCDYHQTLVGHSQGTMRSLSSKNSRPPRMKATRFSPARDTGRARAS